jgi:hypothetical protein
VWIFGVEKLQIQTNQQKIASSEKKKKTTTSSAHFRVESSKQVKVVQHVIVLHNVALNLRGVNPSDEIFHVSEREKPDSALSFSPFFLTLSQEMRGQSQLADQFARVLAQRM